jgi:Cys-tRNA(Pro)/Cys-tRNA(Cys) deacylase
VTGGGAKTNAVRLLDSLGIAYELLRYEVDLEDLAADSVARKLGLPPQQVWKTLLCVLQPGGGHCFAVLAGSDALDLKKLARATGARSAALAPLRAVEPLTGYVRGGVTVLAARKPFPAIVDESLELHERVSVSAGQRGLQLWLAPEAYLRAIRVAGEATLAEIAADRAAAGAATAPGWQA